MQQLLIFWNSLIPNSVVYLDFRKSFDSVAHNELLLKRWHFDICGSLWRWFKAYLSDRCQYVSVGHSTSGVLPVISGVPQGSILGPLLLHIYINNLSDKLSLSKILLLADDAKCFMSISSRADCLLSLQSDLSSLADWSSTWKLTFNEKNCSIVHITRGQSSVILSYTINNTIISPVGSQKDLGVILSADMQWRSHYLFIILKARWVFSSVTDVYVKPCLYLSLIRSHLLYCSPLWRP